MVELFVLPGRPRAKTGLTETGLADGIDDFVDVIGRVVAWITIAQVVLVAMDVILRYLFRIGPMDLQELEWHLISPIALIGMCYAQRHGDHVKVDIIYDKFPEKTKNIIDLLAALITITVSVLIIYFAIGFVDQAYFIDEGSPDPGGLPHRWLLRSFIPVGFAILTMQALSNLLKTYDRIFRQSSTTANGE
ncbi:MAG TPA: TRAP transporter small permease subunit [Alphaproteobacteria bacterium]|nr:TRAP transporter small permease subunit [Alphaproteobacteria bacterium]